MERTSLVSPESESQKGAFMSSSEWIREVHCSVSTRQTNDSTLMTPTTPRDSEPTPDCWDSPSPFATPTFTRIGAVPNQDAALTFQALVPTRELTNSSLKPSPAIDLLRKGATVIRKSSIDRAPVKERQSWAASQATLEREAFSSFKPMEVHRSRWVEVRH